MFNDFDENENIILKQLMKENYTQKYFDECNYIWKNYVPEIGQANVLQGELLRELEKLRYEAQNNGNMNWDKISSIFAILYLKRFVSKIYIPMTKKEKLH